jgi:hypothetical protein
MEPEAGQPRLLRQGPPCCPPAIDVCSRVKSGDVVAYNLLPGESELGNECGKDVVRGLRQSEGFSPPA